MKQLLLLFCGLISFQFASATGHTVSIVSSSNVTCNGLCNGSATATVSGGVGPFAYSWNSTPVQTTATAINLCAGSYTVTVTDNSDMSTATAVVVISQPSPMTNTAFPGGPFCPGSCTTIISSTTGGTGPYTYLWTPSFGLVSPTVQNPTACLSGAMTYTLTSTDINGCTANTVVTVVASLPIFASFTVTSTPCGLCNGGIVCTPSGGSAPYTYSWTGPSGFVSTVASPSSLCAGTYTVNVTDANGCSYTGSATVNSTGGPTVVMDTLINLNCLGASSGTIGVHATGGTGTYTYLWSPGGQTTPTVTGLAPGIYSVTVSDGSGCDGYASYTIVNTTSLYPNISTTPANCSPIGTATAFPYGGTAPFSYLWSDGQTTPTATGLAGGIYSVTITDSLGCAISAYADVSAGCYNVLKGKVYNDANSNCIQDVGEVGLPGRVVHDVGGVGYAYTDVNGDYTMLTANMNPTVYAGAYGYPTGFFTPTCPATGSTTLSFSTPGDTLSNVNFGFYADTNYTNLVIHPGWTTSNPGYPKTYWICYYNNSPGPRNATLRFVYDSTLQFVSTTGGGVHYPATHTIEWNLTALAPATFWDWASRPIITFNVPPTALPGDSLQSYFEILPIAGDAYPSDNTMLSNEPITGSHDPNSKSVMPKGYGPQGYILASDSVLTYTVHFQNNGNDTARIVVVKDTLSSYLDPMTIVPGAASHPYTFELGSAGAMTFRFDNIQLPDSTSDEPGSNGYFNYSVHIRPGTPIGTVINNTASIYFDFNEAVVTNTTVNTLYQPMATAIDADVNSAAQVLVYPNPFSTTSTVVIRDVNANAVYHYELRDVLGKIVQEQTNIHGSQFEISRRGLENGIYFYTVKDAGGLVGQGKLLIK